MASHLFEHRAKQTRSPLAKTKLFKRASKAARTVGLEPPQDHGTWGSSAQEYLLRGKPLDVSKAKGRWTFRPRPHTYTRELHPVHHAPGTPKHVQPRLLTHTRRQAQQRRHSYQFGCRGSLAASSTPSRLGVASSPRTHAPHLRSRGASRFCPTAVQAVHISALGYNILCPVSCTTLAPVPVLPPAPHTLKNT